MDRISRPEVGVRPSKINTLFFRQSLSAFSAFLSAFGLLGTAYADCTDTRVSDLSSLFSGNTVCATGPGANPDRWQEWHQTDGTLTE
jgi:hypothetical protein